MESDPTATLAAATHIVVIAAVMTAATTVVILSAIDVAGMCPLSECSRLIDSVRPSPGCCY